MVTDGTVAAMVTDINVIDSDGNWWHCGSDGNRHYVIDSDGNWWHCAAMVTDGTVAAMVTDINVIDSYHHCQLRNVGYHRCHSAISYHRYQWH